MMSEMQHFAILHLHKNFPSNNEKKKELLNTLPSLKILIIKYSEILNQSNCLSALIHFLFMFLLDQEYGSYFSDFIDLICKSIKAEMQKSKSSNLVTNLQTIIMSEFGQICQFVGNNEQKNNVSLKNFIRSITRLMD